MVILSVVAMAVARPQVQPAGFACPNYPFCAIAAPAAAPAEYQPHRDLYLAQRQALNQPLVADVPGIAQWYQELHAVSYRRAISCFTKNLCWLKLYLK